jgi:hypothetical protein
MEKHPSQNWEQNSLFILFTFSESPNRVFYAVIFLLLKAGNTKGGSINVQLTFV